MPRPTHNDICISNVHRLLVLVYRTFTTGVNKLCQTIEGEFSICPQLRFFWEFSKHINSIDRTQCISLDSKRYYQIMLWSHIKCRLQAVFNSSFQSFSANSLFPDLSDQLHFIYLTSRVTLTLQWSYNENHVGATIQRLFGCPEGEFSIQHLGRKEETRSSRWKARRHEENVETPQTVTQAGNRTGSSAIPTVPPLINSRNITWVSLIYRSGKLKPQGATHLLIFTLQDYI